MLGGVLEFVLQIASRRRVTLLCLPSASLTFNVPLRAKSHDYHI